MHTGVSERSANTDKLRLGGIIIVVVCAVFVVAASLAVVLRLWARRIKRIRLSLNDYLAVAALVRDLQRMSR